MIDPAPAATTAARLPRPDGRSEMHVTDSVGEPTYPGPSTEVTG